MKNTHEQYQRMQSRWEMCRDAAAGEYEIHEKNVKYLPKLNKETNEEYNKRLQRTPFFNATWRTIKMLRGMLFRKTPDFNVPESMADVLNNIDNTGESMTTFSQKVALESLTVGRCGILVEHTQVPEGITAADADSMGARAFITMYTAESILDWNTKIIKGRRTLSKVRLKETIEDYEDIDLKEGEEINRILELDNGIYVQRIVIVGDKQEDQTVAEIIPRMNNSPLNFIPFQPAGIDQLTIDVEIPPLIDLITLNLHHYRQSSSYEHGCHLSGLPTFCVYGNSDEEKVIYLGGSTGNSFPDPQARAEFVEVKSGFEALRNNLKEKEHQMAVLGAKMLEPQRSGVESAETWERKQAGEESTLADISTTLSRGLTIALKWMAEWQGHDPEEVSVELNKQFLPYAMTPQQITALVAANIQGRLSYNALYHNFNRAGLYPDGTTMEQETADIAEESI